MLSWKLNLQKYSKSRIRVILKVRLVLIRCSIVTYILISVIWKYDKSHHMANIFEILLDLVPVFQISYLLHLCCVKKIFFSSSFLFSLLWTNNLVSTYIRLNFTFFSSKYFTIIWKWIEQQLFILTINIYALSNLLKVQIAVAAALVKSLANTVPQI